MPSRLTGACSRLAPSQSLGCSPPTRRPLGVKSVASSPFDPCRPRPTQPAARLGAGAAIQSPAHLPPTAPTEQVIRPTLLLIGPVTTIPAGFARDAQHAMC